MLHLNTFEQKDLLHSLQPEEVDISDVVLLSCRFLRLNKISLNLVRFILDHNSCLFSNYKKFIFENTRVFFLLLFDVNELLLGTSNILLYIDGVSSDSRTSSCLIRFNHSQLLVVYSEIPSENRHATNSVEFIANAAQRLLQCNLSQLFSSLKRSAE